MLHATRPSHTDTMTLANITILELLAGYWQRHICNRITETQYCSSVISDWLELFTTDPPQVILQVRIPSTLFRENPLSYYQQLTKYSINIIIERNVN